MTAAQTSALSQTEAVTLLRSGSVLAYPTEAVFGLGCDPWNEAAVDEILRLKGRPADKGLIALAGHPDQVRAWVDCDPLAWRRAEKTWPGPVTWVFNAARAPAWLCADDGSVAIRVSAHPPAARLALAFGGPIVSTSANPAGRAPARTHAELRRYFALPVMTGRLGGLDRPSRIVDARSGRVIRA